MFRRTLQAACRAVLAWAQAWESVAMQGGLAVRELVIAAACLVRRASHPR